MSTFPILHDFFVVCFIRNGAFMNFIGPSAKLGLYAECSIRCVPPDMHTFVPKLEYHTTQLGMFR